MASIVFDSFEFRVIGKTQHSKDIVQCHLDESRHANEEKLEYAKKLQHIGLVHSQYGQTEEIVLSSGRTFVFHTSKSHDPHKEVPLLFFFHGARGNAWNCALQLTKWIEKTNEQDFVVVFGQAVGEKHPNFVDIHEKYKGLHFGELYWEIRDNMEGFKNDLAYIEDILTYVKSQHCINMNQIFFMGHSNGGVFSLLLLLYRPRLFAAVCSHMGGIGWDPAYYLDFSLLKEDDPRTPLLLVTGDQDVHKEPCEAAKNIFEGENFPVVELVILPNTKHKYSHTGEDLVWKWFLEQTKK